MLKSRSQSCPIDKRLNLRFDIKNIYQVQRDLVKKYDLKD